MRKRFLLVLGIVSVLIALFLLVLHSPLVKSRILNTTLNYLKKSQGIELKAHSFGYNLLKFQFVFEDAVLQGESKLDFPPFLHAERIKLRLPLALILGARFQIKKLEIRNPVIDFHISESGENNLPFRPETTQRIEYIFNMLRVENGRFFFSDQSKDISFELKGIEMTLEWQGRGKHSLRVDTDEKGYVNLRGIRRSIDRLNGRGVLDYSSVDFKEFMIGLEQNEVKLAGRLTYFPSLHMNLELLGSLDLSDARAVLLLEKEFSGRLDFRAHLEGPPDSVDTFMELQSDDLQFEGSRKIQLETSIRWKDRALVIPFLHAVMGNGEIEGNAEFYLEDGKADNHLELKWKAVPLYEVTSFLNRPYPFVSEASGWLELSWPGLSLDEIRGRTEIQLIGPELSPQDMRLIPLSGSILGRSDSGKFNVTLQSLSLPGAQIGGEFQLDSESLSGKFELDASNLDSLFRTLMANSEKWSAADLKGIDVDGQMSVSGSLEGSLQSPRIKAEVGKNRISIGELKDLEMAGEIVLDTEGVKLEQFQVQKNEEKVQMSGFFPLRPSQQAMDIQIIGKELFLEKILDLLALDIPAEGRMDFNAHLMGRLENPLIQSSVIFTDLSLYGETLSRLESSFSYQDKEIILDSLSAKQAEGRVGASGRYNMETQSYSVRFSAENLKVENVTIPPFPQDLRTILNLQLEGNGTIRSPRFEGKGLLKELSYGNKEMGDLEIQVHATGEKADFQIEAPLYSAVLRGFVSLTGPFPLALTLKVDTLSFNDFKERMLFKKEQEISGDLSGQVDFRMDLSNPRETLNIHTHITQLKFVSGQHHVKNEGPIDVFYDSNGIQIENMVLTGAGMFIRANGSLPRQASSGAELYTDAVLDLSLITHFLPDWEADGVLRLESHAKGSLLRPEVTAVVDLAEAKVHLKKLALMFEDVQLHLDIKDNAVHIEPLSFHADGGKYELKGFVPFEAVPSRLLAGFQISGSRTAELQFQIRDFKPSLLSSVFAQKTLNNVNGKIDGEIRIEGKSLRLNQVSARAALETLDLDILDIPLSQDVPTEIVLDKGKVLIQEFSLKGAESRLRMSGSVDLYRRKSINMRVDGDLDLEILKVFMEDAFFTGKCVLQIQATETMKSPSINGFMEVQKAGFQMAYPGIFLDQVNGRIELDQSKLKIERLQGDLNGGALVLDGEMDFRPWALTTSGVNIRIENALLNFPKDLNSQISSELKLESDGSKHLLKGTVDILTARYTESFSLESAIYRYFQRGAAIETFKEPHVILKDLHFDLAIRTVNPFLIDNNISKSEMMADLKLTGNFYNPALSGRIDFLEGGKVFFGKNTFLIEKGTVDFISTNRIVPDINLMARTRVSEYDVQLILTGTPDRLSAQLLSDPHLSEPNIVSLLVTGRRMDSVSAPLLSAAGSGALSYINNTLTGKVEQVTMKSLGIESVRLDASLVSTQEDPGARVTFGQHITRDFELVFSQDLKDARNRTWILNFNPVSNVNLQGVKQDNNEYNFSLRHELRFGLHKEKKQPRIDSQKKGPFVGSIIFEGQLGVSENRIRNQMKSKPKKRFDFYKFQRDQDRIRDLYRKNDYLSSSVAVEKKEDAGKVDFVIRVESGSKIHLGFQGGDIPRKLKTGIEKSWMGSSYGPMVIENIRQRILLHFLKKRYYQVNVRTREYLSKGNERVIGFSIDKGVKFNRLDIACDGNQFLTRDRIIHYLRKNRLLSALFVNSEKVARNIESLYSQNGFLRTRVRLQDINFDEDKNTAHVLFRIDEGSQFKVRTVSIRGIRFFPEEIIINQIQIHQGDVFSPKTFNDAKGRIRELYAQKGFNNVNVQSQIQIHEEAAEIDLLFNVEENDQAVIEKVHLSGNAVTRPRVIHRELLFKEGNTVNFLTINQTRKRLYDLGIFERVNINVLPMESHDSSLTREDGTGPVRPYQLDVEVEELKPFRLRYGFLFDTDTGLGASGELVNRNVFGRAQLLGTSFRADQDERDFRVFFRSHYFLSKRINTELFTFVKRSEMPAFTVDRTGFTIQQQHSISRSDILSYNYTFGRNHTFARTPEGQLSTDTSVHVGSLNTAFTRDTRDNILNASRGIFFSQSVGYAAKLFGSDVNFVRYFGQFNAYARLSDFLVYAVGLRIGLSKGLGQEMIPSEKFFAGGGTTIRGFGKNEIGPLDPSTGLAEGGDAVLIVNQELRFPIYKRLSGAAFLDLGNVYSALSDFNLFKVRQAAGFGLRYNTPFVLVRVDWGFKLDRKPGEALSRIFLSIGQAF